MRPLAHCLPPTLVLVLFVACEDSSSSDTPVLPDAGLTLPDGGGGPDPTNPDGGAPGEAGVDGDAETGEVLRILVRELREMACGAAELRRGPLTIASLDKQLRARESGETS